MFTVKRAYARRRFVLPAMLLCAGFACAGTAFAQSRPVETESPDELLWREVKAAESALRETPPYQKDVEAALAPRRLLLKKSRFYLTAYPGGRRRDTAIRLVLNTLFEIGVLTGGDFTDLESQTRRYIERPPSRAALHEAAYWKIRCECVTAAASQPSSAPVQKHDQKLLAAYRTYIAEYPKSRHTPRMAMELFQAASDARDEAAMRGIAATLERVFPDHLTTRHLQARLRRLDALGRPFPLRLNLIDGGEFDVADWCGNPVLVVVWAAFDDDARRLAHEIEEFREENPDLRVIGVNLDASTESMTAALKVLGLTWPQSRDELGWAGEFVRTWGVREIPTVFAIDPAGNLTGWSGADGWRRLASDLTGN